MTPAPPATGMGVDTSSRAAVLAYYHNYFSSSENAANEMGWAGNSSTGVAGTTSDVFKNDVLRRINFYRGLCGYPTGVVFDATKSAKCQQAALMMSANGALNHSPPKSWKYYTADGAEAAADSNLSFGSCGPDAVDSYMMDSGTGHEAAPHRRWLLYSLLAQSGSGDIPANNGRSATNALWVIGPPYATNQPVKFAAWPNEGYCPSTLAPERWSLSFPNANFASATVTMKKGNTNVPVTVSSKNDNGFGDSAIVWKPTSAITTTEGSAYTVTVSGISGSGVATSKSYTVTFFDPASLQQTITLSGPSIAPVSGARFNFTPVSGADAYQVEVFQQAAAEPWLEGAEDSPPPRVISGTTGSYALRETAFVHTGVKAFHLVFPEFADQFFTIDRDILPQANSHLTYYDIAKSTTTANTLSAEVSRDGGVTWKAVSTRNGVGFGGETSWNARDVDLSAYAGQTIRIRFAARYVGSAYNSATVGYGFYIDDISVSNTLGQGLKTLTELPSTATSFILNASTVGEPLADGEVYQVHVRPGIGSEWFDFSNTRSVTVHSTTSYADWVSTFFPTLTGGFTGDGDKDGISNGVEYAFGLNPLQSDTGSAIPAATVAGGLVYLDYQQPDGITDLVYGAEYSTDLATWTKINDTGSGGHHRFEVSTTGRSKVFLRHVIDQAK